MAVRSDSEGLFWHDVAKVKAAPKAKIKREPPFPFWRMPGYAPGLQEAQAFNVDLFTDLELIHAQAKGERLVWDIECYPNYFLVCFKSIDSGKVVYFQHDGDKYFDIPKLSWVLKSFTIVSFNGKHYDEPITAIALSGFYPEHLWEATKAIITYGERPYKVLQAYKVKQLDLNHIDIKEVAPLHDSLKIYAGRIHTRKMQDLPFEPGTVLEKAQMDIVRFYCINDLDCTIDLYRELREPLKLREEMTAEFKTDVRSRSDAQLAEAVIMSELKKLTGKKHFKKPTIKVGWKFNYKVPSYIKYESGTLNWVLDRVREAQFEVSESGKVIKPQGFPLKFEIAGKKYNMGIGGLHSCEKSVTHRAGEDWFLIDRDVASFYPRVILTQNLFPEHLGPEFIKVYRGIVERRLAAKDQAANLKKKYKGQAIPVEVQTKIDQLTVVADSLKITINGSFGKFGNGFSMLYSPNLMIQVTLTGQLVILMLIERLEIAGISVVSANTDGIVIKCHKAQKETLDAIVAQWEKDIDCQTEETLYASMHQRDVNAYFAIKPDGEIKVKGEYAEKGSAGNSRLSKNPVALIASDAVKEYLLKGTPIDHTIHNCKDVRRFLVLRMVEKGAVNIFKKDENGNSAKQDEFLGKAIRWIQSTEENLGELVNAANGNKVPMSEGARPIMVLPDALPGDIDYGWYEEKANKILEEIGL